MWTITIAICMTFVIEYTRLEHAEEIYMSNVIRCKFKCRSINQSQMKKWNLTILNHYYINEAFGILHVLNNVI